MDAIHGGYVHVRRVRVLARHIAEVLPADVAHVLDVGCGDGALAERVMHERPGVRVEGTDVFVRPATRIPVTRFDGHRLPFADRAFDAAMLVDVLHHTEDPMGLLREAARVSRRCVVIKDHLRDGWLAAPTLRLMDRVGNARHGVALPHTYWSRAEWTAAFTSLGLVPGEWRSELGLYPAVVNWVFGRGLHFLARVGPAGTSVNTPPWEAAYLRFETPRQEIAKFVARLRVLGADTWPKDAAIVDLFCGRGGGLRALESLGFTRLDGVDLSPSLLGQYAGRARTFVADCRQLPFADGSRDVAIVQGGLHHLPALPDDLDRVIAEVHRVLVPGGRFVVVEPWLTPFLRAVHAACRQRVARAMWPKLDALAVMIEHERETYEQWLGQPAMIRDRLSRAFATERRSEVWGKFSWVGRKEPAS